MELGDIDISGRIFSGGNLEMGTEHVMDVRITCYRCTCRSGCGLKHDCDLGCHGRGLLVGRYACIGGF